MSRSIINFLEGVSIDGSAVSPITGGGALQTSPVPIASWDKTPNLNILPPPLPKKKKQIIPAPGELLIRKRNKHQRRS